MAAPTPDERTPSEQVFSTTEILEAILLEVNDMHTLLLSQLINSKFHATINGSFKLRRALWFEATPPSDQPKNFPQLNPLLAKHHTNLNMTVLTTGNMAQNRTDMLGYWNYLEVRVIAKHDQSSWMRMLPFQTKEKYVWALGCPFVCEEREGREMPATWTFREGQEDVWLAPEHCEEWVGKEVFITKCTMLGEVEEPMTIREMFEAAVGGGVVEQEDGLSLDERMARLEMGEDGGDDANETL